MENIDVNSELAKTLAAWADITIKELRQSMVNKYIGQSGDLYKSFEPKVFYGADGAPSRVTIGFKYHGRFVDMGVGNGIKIENQKTNREVWRNMSRADRKGMNPRKPKKWYSPVAYRQYQILAELLTKKYSITIPALFEEMFNASEAITIKL